mmetsp:Transcript_46514/g.86642  ORF Transcript_46514/g.86642 Transcript_46514/m.86642 type:complete len:105 (-) Transcript_46514:1155-1469(-)
MRRLPNTTIFLRAAQTEQASRAQNEESRRLLRAAAAAAAARGERAKGKRKRESGGTTVRVLRKEHFVFELEVGMDANQLLQTSRDFDFQNTHTASFRVWVLGLV